MGGEYEDVELEKSRDIWGTGYQRGVTGREPVRPGEVLVENWSEKRTTRGFQCWSSVVSVQKNKEGMM